MTGEPRSPAAARLLLGALLPERYRDNQLGDLEEEFRERGRRVGWPAARRWYWTQAIASIPGAGRVRYRVQRHDPGSGGAGMERWLQDLRYAVRSLLKSPQHTIVATLTLALAIGVNTSIFSLVNQILFLELPIEEPDELYWVWSLNAEARSDIVPLSLADFQDLRERDRSFESLAAMQQTPVILTGVDRPERIVAARVTANLMDVWGAPTVIGRGFVEGEDLAGAPDVAVIAHSMWEEAFGRSPDVLGETIGINGTPYTIVGVASPQMETGNLGRATVMIPLRMTQTGQGRDVRAAMVTGRLRDGVTFEQARAEGTRIGEELAAENPVTNRGWEIQVRTTDDSLLGDTAQTIMLLLVLTVGLVLLIACANVANLVLVRASTRVRELAVRSALGAARARIVRQILTENLVVAIVAGGIGIALAHTLLRALVSVTRGREVLFTMATVDRRVLGFTVLVSLATPLLFGLLPALGTVRGDLAQALRDGPRGGGARKGHRTRNALVVAQVALALSLMLGSGILARTVIALQSVEPGYRAEGVMSAVVQLPDTRYDDEQAVRFFDELEDRLAEIPSVRSVALAGSRPQSWAFGGQPLAIDGQEGTIEDLPTAYPQVVTGGYFDALRIPIESGRTFDERDRVDTAPVAIVSRETVERFWPGQSALGRRVRVGVDPSAPWREVVGVVGNVAGGRDPSNPDVPQVYVPVAQQPGRALVLLARADGDERTLATPIREAVWALDAEQPVDDVRSMTDVLYDESSFQYAIMTLFGSFAFFALAMAVMGLYGVMSFMVSQRQREIGVRLALGAERSTVLRMVMRQGGTLTAIGSVIGLALGLLISRIAAGIVVGVSAYDAVTFVGVPLVLLAAALVANLIPARRATRIDPMRTLRTD